MFLGLAPQHTVSMDSMLLLWVLPAKLVLLNKNIFLLDLKRCMLEVKVNPVVSNYFWLRLKRDFKITILILRFFYYFTLF